MYLSEPRVFQLSMCVRVQENTAIQDGCTFFQYTDLRPAWRRKGANVLINNKVVVLDTFENLINFQ